MYGMVYAWAVYTVSVWHAWTSFVMLHYRYIGLARTIYIRCTYGIFGLEITKYTEYIYVYIRFWPTLQIYFGPDS